MSHFSERSSNGLGKTPEQLMKEGVGLQVLLRNVEKLDTTVYQGIHNIVKIGFSKFVSIYPYSNHVDVQEPLRKSFVERIAGSFNGLTNHLKEAESETHDYRVLTERLQSRARFLFTGLLDASYVTIRDDIDSPIEEIISDSVGGAPFQRALNGLEEEILKQLSIGCSVVKEEGEGGERVVDVDQEKAISIAQKLADRAKATFSYRKPLVENDVGDDFIRFLFTSDLGFI